MVVNDGFKEELQKSRVREGRSHAVRKVEVKEGRCVVDVMQKEMTE